MNDLSYVPQAFREAGDQMDVDRIKLENLLTTSRFAALWEKEHDSGVADGPQWSMLLQGPIKEAMTRLAVSISDFKKTVFLFVPKGKKEEPSERCSVLVNDTIKLQDLLNLYEIVAAEEEEGGHDEKVNWPTAFSISLDILARIEATSGEVWDKTAELIKPEEIKSDVPKEVSVEGMERYLSTEK
jgi:hypothetical protein